jgi:regulator of protease activity HflC (stomatin/prohibitin superfamily)
MEYFGIVIIGIVVAVLLFSLITWHEEKQRKEVERWQKIERIQWTLNDVKRELEDLDHRSKYQLNGLHAKVDQLAKPSSRRSSK